MGGSRRGMPQDHVKYSYEKEVIDNAEICITTFEVHTNKPILCEVYTSIKELLKLTITMKKELWKKHQRRRQKKNWNNYGYVFVDCDYNIVKEKDYETYRQNHKKIQEEAVESHPWEWKKKHNMLENKLLNILK